MVLRGIGYTLPRTQFFVNCGPIATQFRGPKPFRGTNPISRTEPKLPSEPNCRGRLPGLVPGVPVPLYCRLSRADGGDPAMTTTDS
jgi:hypothetical protein